MTWPLRRELRLRKAVDVVAGSATPIEAGTAAAREKIWTPEKQRSGAGLLAAVDARQRPAAGGRQHRRLSPRRRRQPCGGRNLAFAAELSGVGSSPRKDAQRRRIAALIAPAGGRKVAGTLNPHC